MKNAVGLLTALLALLGIVLLAGSSAKGAEGGYSNYIPGTYGDFAAAVEPPTKFTLRNDIYYYQADGARSVRSGLVEADADLEFIMDFLTLLYKPDIEILNAHYAFGVFIPIVYADIDTGVRIGNQQVRLQDDTFGIGDLTFVPGILFWNHGNFHFTLSEYIIAPTGKYDTDDLANTGLNYWTFDTNIAVTYLNEKTGQDYSVNVGYNYNTENSDTDYQTGQEVHIDYMVNQFLSDSFALGIQGFYLKQVTGDSGDGALLGGFKAEAAGIGPAVLWSSKSLGREVTFIGKWLHEYHADRRLEGDHVFLSFAMSF
jgi:hypothetical protein